MSIVIRYRYELKNVAIIWAIRHKSISATFFDEGAAEFFKPMLLYGYKEPNSEDSSKSVSKRFRITVEKTDDVNKSAIAGCALGPDWATDVDISGQLKVIIFYIFSAAIMGQIYCFFGQDGSF